MAQSARAFTIPVISPRTLQRLETHFIAPDIYRRDDVAVRQIKLARIVSADIVPRLLRLQTEVPTKIPADAELIEALAPSSADVSTLADIVLGTDLEAAAAFVLGLRDQGLAMETLFIELLEPTARHLGDMWDNDECDFIDVTLGVARLQKLLAIFNDTHTLPSLGDRRNVLMAAGPGEQHSFGIRMVEKFLLGAGWRVETELSSTVEGIVEAVHGKWFAIAGLTAGSDRQIASLTTTISELRKHSKNPSIGVMVGGPMFTANPELAQDVGADATAPNAPTAVLVAQKLFDLAEHRARSG